MNRTYIRNERGDILLVLEPIEKYFWIILDYDYESKRWSTVSSMLYLRNYLTKEPP